MLSCARAPFPVMISPIKEKAMPSWANLPTKSSLDFVNPNRGPCTQQNNEKFFQNTCHASLDMPDPVLWELETTFTLNKSENEMAIRKFKRIDDNVELQINYLPPWDPMLPWSFFLEGSQLLQCRLLGHQRSGHDHPKLQWLQARWKGWRKEEVVLLRKWEFQSLGSTEIEFLFLLLPLPTTMPAKIALT